MTTPRASPTESAPSTVFWNAILNTSARVVFIQAGVMSRTNIIAYQQLADQIERLLDDVNSRFATDNWQPIMYMPTDLPSLT